MTTTTTTASDDNDPGTEIFDEFVAQQFLRNYIRSALQDRAEANNQLYTKLLCEIRELRYKAQRREPDSITQFCLLVDTLADSLTQVRKEYHWSLFKSLYERFDMWVADTSIRRVFVKLAINLAISSAEFVEPVTSFFVSCLFPNKEKQQRIFQADWGSWQPSERGAAIQNEILDGIHFLMKLRPASKLDINEYLQVRLIKPHPLWGKRWYCYYFRALLWLSDKDEGLREQFWAILLDLLIKLDTCIWWHHISDQQAIVDGGAEEDEQLVMRNPDEFDEEIFEMDNEQHEAELKDTKNQTKEKSELPQIEHKSWADLQASDVLISYIQADKLDILQGMMFDYIQRWEQRGEILLIWKMMLANFDNFLLAGETKFVPFLLFNVISKRPERFGPEFLEMLWQRFESSHDSSHIRRYCTSFISSFCCRAKLCPRDIVLDIIRRCVQWIKKYIQLGRKNHDGLYFIDNEVYALFRGVLIMLCYNMKPAFMFGSPTQIEQLRSLIEKDLVEIAENPADVFLRCSKEIVGEFLRQTKMLKLPDFSKYTQGEITLIVQKQYTRTKLKFPFDPYLLEQSQEYLNLEKHYTRWQHIQALFTVEELREAEEEVVEEEEQSNVEDIIHDAIIEEQDDPMFGVSIGGDSVEVLSTPEMFGSSPIGASPTKKCGNTYFDQFVMRCESKQQEDVEMDCNGI